MQAKRVAYNIFFYLVKNIQSDLNTILFLIDVE